MTAGKGREKRASKANRLSSLSDQTVGIVGDGAFATALASVLSTEQRTAVMLVRDEDVRRDINRNHRNLAKLPGVSLSKMVTATHKPEELTNFAQVIVIAVASDEATDAVDLLAPHLSFEHTVAHAVRSLVDGHRRVSQLIRANTKVVKVAALAGPALPRDLIARRVSALVAASENAEAVVAVKRALAIPTLRIYRSPDMLGVELSSAFSGALAIALGVADGLDIGIGPRTYFLTRAAAEAARICAAAGASERTFFGLAGLGNLLLRTAPESRMSSIEYQLGLSLARGTTPPEWQTEGTRALATAAEMSTKLDVEAAVFPVIDAVVRRRMTPDEAADKLGRLEIDLE